MRFVSSVDRVVIISNMNDDLTINTIIETIERAYPPVDPGCGFFHDVDNYFCCSGSMVAASSELINEPLCMLELKGRVGESFSSMRDMATLMYAIWGELSYNAFEASSCIHYRQASVLRFVTVPSFQDYYISGRMVVSSVKQEQLVEQFEKGFGGITKLDDLPAGIEAL